MAMKTLANPTDAAELRGRAAQLTPQDMRLWGLMSVEQMICHVADSFLCPLGERKVTPFKPPPIPVPLYKWLALHTPAKWPHGVPTTPEMDQRIGGTPPSTFTADLDRLLRELDRTAAHTGPWGEHPMFGAMTRREWLRWGWLHTDHHLRQFGR